MKSPENIYIVAYMCWKWGYGAGDMAGTIRAQYPTTIRPIRCTCTGRVSADLIMRAFGKGADGVAVVGWYKEECDFRSGSKQSTLLVDYLKTVLHAVGINPIRLQKHYCSAAEGQKFQRTMTVMTREIHSIGESPLKELIKEKINRKSASKSAPKKTK